MVDLLNVAHVTNSFVIDNIYKKLLLNVYLPKCFTGKYCISLALSIELLWFASINNLAKLLNSLAS